MNYDNSNFNVKCQARSKSLPHCSIQAKTFQKSSDPGIEIFGNISFESND